MQVAFYGDSLTEGNFGVSFLDILRRKLPSYELLNYGEGGDTVLSLYDRILHMQPTEQTDLAVLWIGINDIFGSMTWLYRVINKIRKKRYASIREEWNSFYLAILDALLESSKGIIAIPPFLLGEDPDSKWNRMLGELGADIRAFSDEFEKVVFLDLRGPFIAKLNERKRSTYLPTSMIQFMRDKWTCTTIEEVDRRSSERGLSFTLDGVHLNSKGAEMVTDFLKDSIEKMSQ
jgi:lysophospholipase L1-like esterase